MLVVYTLLSKHTQGFSGGQKGVSEVPDLDGPEGSLDFLESFIGFLNRIAEQDRRRSLIKKSVGFKKPRASTASNSSASV